MLTGNMRRKCKRGTACLLGQWSLVEGLVPRGRRRRCPGFAELSVQGALEDVCDRIGCHYRIMLVFVSRKLGGKLTCLSESNSTASTSNKRLSGFFLSFTSNPPIVAIC
jgi:hypothetical protein